MPATAIAAKLVNNSADVNLELNEAIGLIISCLLFYNSQMSGSGHEDDLKRDIAEEESLVRELSFLFGEDIVKQARLLDIANLNMTDEMTAGIRNGIKQLKQLKNDPGAQKQWLEKQESGLRLLLCLWIMDMGLLEKIQVRSYVTR